MKPWHYQTFRAAVPIPAHDFAKNTPAIDNYVRRQTATADRDSGRLHING